MRACRTDKGVHAAGQVVSLKMLIRNSFSEEGEDLEALTKMTAEINKFLPDQIRVFGIKRTINSFHAKEKTDSRIYEYLLPTYVLRQIDRAVYFEANQLELVEDRTEKFEFPPIEENVKEELRAFRIDSDRLERTRALFKQYIGSHFFHNFTIGLSAKEETARRYIIDISVGQPFVREGFEWISVRFHGQSFMLHQIRKMVGLVIMAVRLDLDPSIVTKCFAPDKVNIPKAPALGLLLDRAIFAEYNKHHPSNSPIDFLEYEEERNKLKEEHICPKIFDEERDTCQFWGWLRCNDDHALDFSFLTS